MITIQYWIYSQDDDTIPRLDISNIGHTSKMMIQSKIGYTTKIGQTIQQTIQDWIYNWNWTNYPRLDIQKNLTQFDKICYIFRTSDKIEPPLISRTVIKHLRVVDANTVGRVCLLSQDLRLGNVWRLFRNKTEQIIRLTFHLLSAQPRNISVTKENVLVI